MKAQHSQKWNKENKLKKKKKIMPLFQVAATSFLVTLFVINLENTD